MTAYKIDIRPVPAVDDWLIIDWFFVVYFCWLFAILQLQKRSPSMCLMYGFLDEEPIPYCYLSCCFFLLLLVGAMLFKKSLSKPTSFQIGLGRNLTGLQDCSLSKCASIDSVIFSVGHVVSCAVTSFHADKWQVLPSGECTAHAHAYADHQLAACWQFCLQFLVYVHSYKFVKCSCVCVIVSCIAVVTL